MKKSSSSSFQNLGSFPSPGAPYYRERNIRSQKGWCSERVSNSKLSTSASSISRRHTMAGLTTTPFCGGRTLPSKWDEAERWICSPVSAYAESRSCSHAQLQRRPKSISGPIVPPGVASFYSNQGLVVRNLVVGSPFSTGVLAPVAVSVHHFDAHDGNVFGYDLDSGMQFSSPVINENGVVLSSLSSAEPTCSEQPCDQSSPISQDEKQGAMNEENVASHSSRCDKGTQMSLGEAENDSHSSPKSCATSVVEQQEWHSPKLEVRDVEVDSQSTIIRWSKRHATKLPKKDTLHSKDSREIREEDQASWDIDEPNIDTSKLQREEAKIIAWENLQKAKAETAIRKLEMKLEKKRSSSMDKILNKLRRAHLKAENMRSSLPVQQGQEVSKCRVFSFSKYAQIWSPTTCFRSHDQ
ncbi:Remorin 4.1 [Glycine soja]